jgi:catechol-2,3-dioxygenase
MGLDHIAMAIDCRRSVDAWVKKLTAHGIQVTGRQIPLGPMKKIV